MKNIKEKYKYDKFIRYLNNYWFKKSYTKYNFSEFINKYYKKEENKLAYFYSTNNIAEGIYSKISILLTKNNTSSNKFIDAITKIFFK